jgi:hypothetical protein
MPAERSEAKQTTALVKRSGFDKCSRRLDAELR